MVHICIVLKMPRQHHLAYLTCSAEPPLVRRAAVAHRCGLSHAAPDHLVGALPPRCWLVLAPGPSDHPPPSSALFSCLRSRHPRQARLDNAARPLQALPRGERRSPSRPCRRHWRRAWPHPHLFPDSTVGLDHSVGHLAIRTSQAALLVRGSSGHAWRTTQGTFGR